MYQVPIMTEGLPKPVHRTTFPMGCYGAGALTPTWLLPSAPWIDVMWRARPPARTFELSNSQADPTREREGHKVQGSQRLKETQAYPEET